MKAFSVECTNCRKAIFNTALFVFYYQVQEAFCDGECLLEWLLAEKAKAKKAKKGIRSNEAEEALKRIQEKGVRKEKKPK